MLYRIYNIVTLERGKVIGSREGELGRDEILNARGVGVVGGGVIGGNDCALLMAEEQGCCRHAR